MAKRETKSQLKKRVFAYYLKHPEVKFYKYYTVDDTFPKSHHTVRKWVNELSDIEENGRKIAEAYQDRIAIENKTVFEYIEEDTQLTVEALQLMKKAIKTKAINAGDDAFTNIKDIAIAYGIVIEKEINLAQLRIKTETLELKKAELQARIDNPEAFSNIIIVKDTDEIALQLTQEASEHYARD